MTLRDSIFGALFILLGGFFMIQAAGFPTFPGQPYGASLLPNIIGGTFLICGTLLILRDLPKGRGNWVRISAELRTKPGAVAALFVVGTALSHILLGPIVGFVPVCLVCLMALFIWFGMSLRSSFLIAVAGTALCWVMFAMVLEVPLPRGVFEGVF